MYMGRVIGTVVATRKDPSLHGIRLLVVQPIDYRGRENGEPQIAIDTVSVGRGERVFLVGSREAADALPELYPPVDAAIIGIVDRVDA